MCGTDQRDFFAFGSGRLRLNFIWDLLVSNTFHVADYDSHYLAQSNVDKTMNYFMWTFSPTILNGWFLDEPCLANGDVVDPWTFNKCDVYKFDGEVLSVAKYQEGNQVEVSFGAFDLLYANTTIASTISKISTNDVQLVPVKVDSATEEFFLVNVLTEIKCIDEIRSELTKWEAGNISRPDKIGQYRSFVKLYIDPATAEGHHIFRPWGWHGALIVSEVLKHEIERIGVADTIFVPAS